MSDTGDSVGLGVQVTLSFLIKLGTSVRLATQLGMPLLTWEYSTPVHMEKACNKK